MNEQIQEVEVQPLAVAPITALDIPMVNLQVETAKRHPRESLAKLSKKIEEDIKGDSEIAAVCFYRRQVGTTKEGKKVFAEGASVRLAELAASHWGNLVVQVSADERADGRGVVARCRVFDAERNVAIEVPAFRTYTSIKADGRQNTYNSAVSFAYRGGIFKIVPKAMVEKLWRLAKSTVEKSAKKPAARNAVIEKLIAAWSKHGVGADILCEQFGIAAITDLTPEMIAQLRGMYTAIEDGEVTIAETFPSLQRGIEQPKQSVRQVVTETPEDVSDEKLGELFGTE